ICTLRKFVWLIVGKNGSDFPKVIMTPLGTMGIDSSDRFVELTSFRLAIVQQEQYLISTKKTTPYWGC
ncbi:hypothetical protein, partial [Planktothrix mougeotii]|uniref:hypothetical protein n=1 Tax=Planktothrix mougeotii TaxID=54306 RepID=UPI001D15DFDD